MTTTPAPALDAQIERNAAALASLHPLVAYGDREVEVTVMDADGGVSTFAWTHHAIGTTIGAHLGALLRGDRSRIGRYDVLAARTAYELVVSDYETGTSIGAWPEPRALVNEVLAHALAAASVSTEWHVN